MYFFFIYLSFLFFFAYIHTLTNTRAHTFFLKKYIHIYLRLKIKKKIMTDSIKPLTICIDRGGTFTDCIGFTGKPGDDTYREFVVKLLSEDPSNYKDAPTEGIRRIVELATGEKHPRSKPVPTTSIGKIKQKIKLPHLLPTDFFRL